MTGFAFSREPVKGNVLRASIGGHPVLGFYLVFRGDPGEVVEMLEEVLGEARRALPAGEYTDERGGQP